MRNLTTIKEVHDLKYCTGHHPILKAHYKSGKRPTEFGNKVWATSLILIEYLKKKPFDLNGLRVLEIGCGWGLIGVYLSKFHSCKVTCSDLDEFVLPIAQFHAELNNTFVEVKKASFNELSLTFLKKFDLIIGAEVCYSEEVSKDITALIKRSHQATVDRFLMADPGRPNFFECYDSSFNDWNSELLSLPGTVNGKETKLLSFSQIH